MNAIWEHFERQTSRTAGRVALVWGDRRITYDVLDAQAREIARQLERRQVGDGAPVAVHLRHSPALVGALLGIARVGGAYVGLDPAWPAARSAEVLRDSGASVLIADRHAPLDADPDCRDTLEVDEAAQAWSAPLISDVESPPAITHPAPSRGDGIFGVVYTSGSTGRPKGVLVTVASVMNRLTWMWRDYPFQPGDLACLYRSYSTVGFSWDCFGALLQGIPTDISPAAGTGDVLRILRSAIDAGVTHMSGSVGFWNRVLAHLDARSGTWPSLRVARVSGEPIHPPLIEQWRRVVPHATLLNIYGATECSGSIAFDTTAFDARRSSRVPVGKPLPGVQAFVVDDDDEILPVGRDGEICIAGVSVARGYLDDPVLTARRFAPLRAGSAAGTRVFRTGDIGRWRQDGALEVLGRRDLQVKIRGFRVELEAVEAHLRACPGIEDAAVYARDAEEGTRLVALVVTTRAVSVGAIRGALAARLPDAMIPADIFAVPTLPRTTSGKIDRPALPDAAGIKLQALAGPVAPRTASEAMVAAAWNDTFGAVHGLGDDFFESGGDSLIGMRILACLGSTLGVDLSLSTIFEHPTIEALSAEIDRLTPGAAGAPVHHSHSSPV